MSTSRTIGAVTTFAGHRFPCGGCTCVLRFRTPRRENNIREKGTGRYNLSKAVNDLTADARLKAEVEKARLEGEKVGREKALIDVMPKPGQQRQQLLKPPVDDKGHTKTLDAVLQDAMQDSEITKMLTGPIAEA